MPSLKVADTIRPARNCFACSHSMTAKTTEELLKDIAFHGSPNPTPLKTSDAGTFLVWGLGCPVTAEHERNEASNMMDGCLHHLDPDLPGSDPRFNQMREVSAGPSIASLLLHPFPWKAGKRWNCTEAFQSVGARLPCGPETHGKTSLVAANPVAQLDVARCAVTAQELKVVRASLRRHLRPAHEAQSLQRVKRLCFFLKSSSQNKNILLRIGWLPVF